MIINERNSGKIHFIRDKVSPACSELLEKKGAKSFIGETFVISSNHEDMINEK